MTDSNKMIFSPQPYHRDKRENKPEFNKMAKKRRKKAKFDAKNRRKNWKK